MDQREQTMAWEVEQKYRVADAKVLETKIKSLGGLPTGIEHQTDTYFRHPCRDFKKTDEAFRFRTINDETFVTYKGPRLAGPVKTRPEIELPIVSNTIEQWRTIWLALGFTIAADVRKTRHVFSILWRSTPVVIALDQVEGLGSFAEIELVVDREQDLSHAHELIQSLAVQIGLTDVEKRSYLGLVLDRQAIDEKQ
jgi:adenylate cyclase, class 2